MQGENIDELATESATTNSLSGQTHTVVQAGTIHGDVTVRTPSRNAPAPRQLPAVSRGFVERPEHLAALDAGEPHDPDGPSPILSIALVCGTAGVGKTALVLHWAHRRSTSFPDGQLYVDLQGYGPHTPLEANDVLAGFLRALGVPETEIPENQSECAGLYRSLLSERRVLVVLDNALSEEQVRPLLPGSSSCRVVVTSRHVLSGLVANEGAEVIRVDPLGQPDALNVLRNLLGNRVDREHNAANALADYCAGLPLALRVAGEVVVSHPSTSLPELVTELADRRTRLDVLDTDNDPSTTARTVFSWSYEQLDTAAARAFRSMGTHPGRGLDRHALATLLDVTPRNAGRLLDTLKRAHLVIEPSSGRFDMHDLLRAYAAELGEALDSKASRSAAVHRLFGYYLHAADRADRIITPHRYRLTLDHEPPSLPEFKDYTSALSWLDAERHNMRAMFHLPDPTLESSLWQLAYTLRGYYFLTKQWRDWRRTHELALAGTQRTGDRYAEAQTRNNLGLALLEQGHWNEAAEHYERARELFEEVQDIHGVSNALANRATVLHYRGDLEPALLENERALAAYERAGSTRNAAITLRSMALIEIDLERFGEATAHLHRALTSFHELGLHLDATMALNCLGEAHHGAGCIPEARRAHEQAYALGAECGSRFEQARAQHGLGRLEKSQGRNAEALECWEEALELYTALAAPEADQLATDIAALRTHSSP